MIAGTPHSNRIPEPAPFVSLGNPRGLHTLVAAIFLVGELVIDTFNDFISFPSITTGILALQKYAKQYGTGEANCGVGQYDPMP
jgi:hypothetical protein